MQSCHDYEGMTLTHNNVLHVGNIGSNSRGHKYDRMNVENHGKVLRGDISDMALKDEYFNAPYYGRD